MTLCNNSPDRGGGVQCSTWHPGKARGCGYPWRRPAGWAGWPELGGRGAVCVCVCACVFVCSACLIFQTCKYNFRTSEAMTDWMLLPNYCLGEKKSKEWIQKRLHCTLLHNLHIFWYNGKKKGVTHCVMPTWHPYCTGQMYQESYLIGNVTDRKLNWGRNTGSEKDKNILLKTPLQVITAN